MKFIFTLLFILTFFGFLAPEFYAQNADSDTVKINTTLVGVPVIVSDRAGRYIPGLKAEDFTVYQDGTKQTIDFFAAQEEPLNVALLLDSSHSTRDVLGEIKDAAKDFVELLQPNDKALVASFDYRVNILSPFTSDRKTLEKAVKKVEIGEQAGTVMRDAVTEVVERSFADVKGRKAIILLTDGKDFGSSQPKSSLLHMLEESDILVYTVFYETNGRANRQKIGGLGNGRIGGGMGRGGMGGRRNGGIFGGGFPRRFPNENKRSERVKINNEDAAEYLQKMSDTTAGRFYQNDVADLRETFGLIADELRKQYRLGYYPKDDENKDAVHEIKVKVNRADVAVRARANYRAK